MHRIEYRDGYGPAESLPQPASPPPAPPPLPDVPDNVSKILFGPGATARKAGVSADNSRFPKNTDVFYVNGINTAEPGSRREAQRYAEITHKDVRLIHDQTVDQFADVGHAIDEAASQARPSFAKDPTTGKVNRSDFPLEELFAAEILSSVKHGHTVHIGAFSRGAVITENAIKIVDKALETQGYSADQIREWHAKNLSLETFNGFSHTVAAGIPAVHYTNSLDLVVAQPVGMGALAPLARAVIDPAVLLYKDQCNVVQTLKDVGAYEKAEGVLNHPNGPVFYEAPASVNPVENHNIWHIFGTEGSADSKIIPFADVRKAYVERANQQRLEIDAVTPLDPRIPAPSSTRPRSQEPTGSDHPSDTPGPEPRPSVLIKTNGTDQHLEAGFHASGNLRMFGAHAMTFQTRDTQNAVHTSMIKISEIGRFMSKEDQSEMRTLAAKGSSVDISLTSDADGLHAHVTHARQHELAQHRGQVPQRTPSRAPSRDSSIGY